MQARHMKGTSCIEQSVWFSTLSLLYTVMLSVGFWDFQALCNETDHTGLLFVAELQAAPSRRPSAPASVCAIENVKSTSIAMPSPIHRVTACFVAWTFKDKLRKSKHKQAVVCSCLLGGTQVVAVELAWQSWWTPAVISRVHHGLSLCLS